MLRPQAKVYGIVARLREVTPFIGASAFQGNSLQNSSRSVYTGSNAFSKNKLKWLKPPIDTDDDR